MLPRILVAALAAIAIAAAAQPAFENPDWKEIEAPPPPELRLQGLVTVEVQGTSMRFGVDPASISVGSDGIVRYVVVATSPGGTPNGIYEGIRCASGDVKVYARHNPDSGWVPARNSDWQPLHTTVNSRYSLQVARSGVCIGRSPNGTAVQIVRDLKASPDLRFQGGGVTR